MRLLHEWRDRRYHRGRRCTTCHGTPGAATIRHETRAINQRPEWQTEARLVADVRNRADHNWHVASALSAVPLGITRSSIAAAGGRTRLCSASWSFARTCGARIAFGHNIRRHVGAVRAPIARAINSITVGSARSWKPPCSANGAARGQRTRPAGLVKRNEPINMA